jgi:eukaryotic-like serine/threonine-protein kinase
MSLSAGVRLGPYEVLSSLGAGGMGEVYRAHDTRLGRDVALKILPDAFATDADRLARFKREAQLLASLNHSNIAAIYGIEEAAGTRALVLELVEGPTLADRIARGPIPVDHALTIARQMAEALEAAHEQGVIHRDLKPANVKVRPDGTVKVLDFGLAKAAAPPEGARAELTASPTITSPAMTRMGIILGTAPYMSPEQARGRAVDRGADIWAWGCVLFEMLAGSRAFEGADTTEIIAAVVKEEPDWSRLPGDAPPGILRLLRRCLEKDSKRRFADMRDARFALDDARAESQNTAGPAIASNRRVHRSWAAVLVLCMAAAGVLVWRSEGTASRFPREMRLEIATPPSTESVSLAMSPDGEKLVFVAWSEGRPVLWLRSLVTGEARPLAGTDGATFPFWSPDNRSIGFFADERLHRIDVDGSALTPLAAAPVGAGGSWSREGTILFTLVPDGPIARVPASGGSVQVLPGSDTSKGGHRFPQFLPDGRHYLYFMAEPPVRGVYVGSLDGPERRRLITADSAAVFVPPGQILFVRAGVLFTQRFDAGSLTFAGDAVPVARGVAVDSTGAAAISTSLVGSLVYRTGAANRQRQLGWFDRSGAQIGEAFPPDSNNPGNPALSPDGRRVLLSRSTEGNADIWMLDVDRRGALTRLTSQPAPDINPSWSPDGTRIVFGAPTPSSLGIFVKPTTTGNASVLFDTPAQEVPADWSRDGRYILYRRQADMSSSVDLWALPMDGDRTPIPVARSAASERTGRFSPDSKWVAFESNESNRYEIYVQPFPGPGPKTLISTGGGRQARWGPEGKELFYIAQDGRLMSVALRYRPDGQVDPASPVALFATRVSSAPNGGSVVEYDVSRDGRRFLMNSFVEQTGAPMTIVLNWSGWR